MISLKCCIPWEDRFSAELCPGVFRFIPDFGKMCLFVPSQAGKSKRQILRLRSKKVDCSIDELKLCAKDVAALAKSIRTAFLTPNCT